MSGGKECFGMETVSIEPTKQAPKPTIIPVSEIFRFVSETVSTSLMSTYELSTSLRARYLFSVILFAIRDVAQPLKIDVGAPL